jgi:ceroid-lipofuscinosis MFS transporter 7
VVAAFSIGQLIASPLAGWWFNRHSARQTILITLVILITANLLYTFAWTPWLVLISRFLVGVGASNATITRAYVGRVCVGDEVNSMMAWMSASQALGFIMGPALAFSLSFVPSEGVLIGSVKFDENNLPGTILLQVVANNNHTHTHTHTHKHYLHKVYCLLCWLLSMFYHSCGKEK